MNATAELDRNFLDLRHRLLDLAAGLDRIERTDESPGAGSDPRRTQLEGAVRVLSDGKGDRTRRVQMVFSIPYAAGWR